MIVPGQTVILHARMQPTGAVKWVTKGGKACCLNLAWTDFSISDNCSPTKLLSGKRHVASIFFFPRSNHSFTPPASCTILMTIMLGFLIDELSLLMSWLWCRLQSKRFKILFVSLNMFELVVSLFLSQILQFVNIYIICIFMHPVVHIYVIHPMVYRYVCMCHWVHKDVSSSATSCDLPSIFYDSACDNVSYRHYADKTSHFNFIKSSWNPFRAYKNFKTPGLSHTDIPVHCHTHARLLWSTA